MSWSGRWELNPQPSLALALSGRLAPQGGIIPPDRSRRDGVFNRRIRSRSLPPLLRGGVPPPPPSGRGFNSPNQKLREDHTTNPAQFLERAMGVEPTTLCLGSRCSTTELRPLAEQDYTTPTAPSPTRSSAGRTPVPFRPR